MVEEKKIKLTIGQLHAIINLLQAKGGLVDYLNFKGQIEMTKLMEKISKPILEFYDRIKINSENNKIKDDKQDELNEWLKKEIETYEIKLSKKILDNINDNIPYLLTSRLLDAKLVG